MRREGILAIDTVHLEKLFGKPCVSTWLFSGLIQGKILILPLVTILQQQRHPSSFSLPAGSVSETDPVSKENNNICLNIVQASVFLSLEDP